MACTLEFGLLMCLTLMDLYAVTLDDGNIAPSVAVVKEAGRQRIKWSLTPAFIRNVIVSVCPPYRPTACREKYTFVRVYTINQRHPEYTHVFVKSVHGQSVSSRGDPNNCHPSHPQL